MINIAEFLQTVTILDTETTGLDPKTAEIVEMATATMLDNKWNIQTQLFNAHNGIPPEASAKNQISTRMIKDQPYFDQSIDRVLTMLGSSSYFVAHNAAYDQQILVSSFNRAQDLELAELFAEKSLWICTWRVARQVYKHQFQDISYGQNYLRYFLDLPVDDSVGVHRAGADVQVCALLLERLINDGIKNQILDSNSPLGPQLVSLTQAHIPVTSWPNGKHKGQPLNNVPTDYFLWALDNMGSLNELNPNYDFDLSESVRVELESRL